MVSATVEKTEERVASRLWINAPATEFLLWGLAFFALRAIVLSLAGPKPFYRDELTFTEGALKLAANRLDTGDYIHGSIMQYLLLGTYLVTALIKWVAGHIDGVDSFIRWYIERPENLRHIARFLMSLGGAAMIFASMFATYSLSRSRSQARIAAVLLLSTPMFHYGSWYIKEDLWAALFGILAATIAFRKGSVTLVGIFFGIAIAAKYTAVTLAPALVVLLAANDGTALSNWKGWLKCSARLSVTALITFVVMNSYTLIRFGSFYAQVREIGDAYIFNPTLNDVRPPLLASLVFREFLLYDIGVATLLCVCGALILSRGKIARQHAALILAPASVIALLAISRAGYSRTLTLALPWLAVLASMAWPLLDNVRWRISKPIFAMFVAALAVAQVAGLYLFMTAVDTRDIARNYVESSVPANAVILAEGIHDFAPEAALSLKPNIVALRAELEEKLEKGASGRLNRMQQSVAAADPDRRFEIVGSKDFAISGTDQLDRADVVITSKWSGIYPEARAYDIPEESNDPSVAEYRRSRLLFFAEMERKGFKLLAEFAPTLRARWSFIDRPDPEMFGLSSWLQNGEKIVGPEIAIYCRPVN
jgi:hypothetical protein